jgi:O-antigen ligase
MIFIYLTSTLVFFFWTLKSVIAKKILIKRTVFDIPIIVFFLSQVLSALFSIDTHTSFFGYYGRFNGGLISLIAYLVLYYGFVSNIEYRHIEKLLKTSLIASVIVILWGIPGWLGHDLSCLLFLGEFNNTCWTDQFRPDIRMFSTLGQPNWLGAYLAINFFIGVYFFIKSININDEWLKGLNKEIKISSVFNGLRTKLLAVYLFLNFSATLFTRSRSAVLALFGGVSVIVAFGLFKIYAYKNINILKKLILPLIVFIVVAPIIFFKTGVDKFDRMITLSTYSNLIKSRVVKKEPVTAAKTSVPVTGVSESFDIRKIVWEGAWKLGMKYPLLGTGVETFAYAYYFARPIEHNLTSEWDYLYNKAHNEYLNYLATTGFAGLVSYLVLIFSFLGYCGYTLLKNKTGERLLIACLMISWMTILVTNFFGFSTSTINLFFYLIPAWVVVLINRGDNVRHPPAKLSFGQYLCITALFLSSLSLFTYFINYFRADVRYARADAFIRINDYESAAILLEQSLNLKYEHVYEDKLSNVLANLAFLSATRNNRDDANNRMLVSETYNQKSLKASPENVLYWKTRAKNYYVYYQMSLDKKILEQGIDALKEAGVLAPTDPKIPYSLAIFYSIAYDDAKDIRVKKEIEDKSIEAINKTISLKKDYRDGYFLKAQLLRKYGRKEEAKETLHFILDHINPDDVEVKDEIMGQY